MKKRIFSLLIAAMLLMAFSCTAFADVQTSYSAYTNNFIDAVGWYQSFDATLYITGENTYELVYKANIFGTTDPGNKGEKTVIYSGTFTSAPAADGEDSHLDITLDTCDNIYFEQHDKAWGRNELNFQMMLNTAAWTDDMEDFCGMAADEFLEAHSVAGKVITVEDLFLDLDNQTLMNRVVAIDGTEFTGGAATEDELAAMAALSID